jgi:zinc/manganese transport system ATP-binding protein
MRENLVGDPSSPVISAEGLEVGYDGRTVWRDATFRVDRGEFAAVIGPNGAGKTTLFRLLLGLLKPKRGTIRVLGDAPTRGSPRIGYVPQRHTIDNDTNIACVELVRLGYSGHRWGFSLSAAREREISLRALQAVHAESLADASLGSLSGGELQRVFLAEALVGNPDLLLLDEPLSNLDLKRTRELVELVNGLVRSRGVTALLVAHDINPLIQHLDKVIYVANRRVATGTPQEVLTSERLTALYEMHVEVLRDSRGNLVIVGGEDRHGDEPA